jgi:hypothetical protein
MFEFIRTFFNKPRQPSYNMYDKHYRAAYNKLWIQKLRDYRP